MPVASHHLVSLTGESGWIAGYKLNLLNGLPQAAVEGDTYTPPGYSGHPVLEPDHVVEVGDNVRGVCFFARLGQAYIAITRCAYLKNYPCAVEFHFLPEEKTVSAGGGSFSNSYTLDGGIPPSKAPAKPKVREAQWAKLCRTSHCVVVVVACPHHAGSAWFLGKASAPSQAQCKLCARAEARGEGGGGTRQRGVEDAGAHGCRESQVLRRCKELDVPHLILLWSHRH